MQKIKPVVFVFLIFFVCNAVTLRAFSGNLEQISHLKTTSGVEFGLLGKPNHSHAPTLFVFASDIDTSLGSETYNKIGSILSERGCLCVSVNLPFHPGAGLDGWATATKQKQSWVSAFTEKVTDVLDYLVREGYTDPDKVAVAGTSRGGFMAAQVAAADPRFRCVIGFIPVTDLTQLTEFAELKNDDTAKSLGLVNIASKLVSRPIWIGIGNHDERVNTDKAIEFARKLVEENIAATKSMPPKYFDVELHVMPWEGHGVTGLPTAHEMAAEWIWHRLVQDKP